MSNERIDLAEIENMRLWTDRYKVGMFWDLIAKLKEAYEREDAFKELCDEFLGQALTLYDVGNQNKDVDYDYREFNKLRARFAKLLDFGGKASE